MRPLSPPGPGCLFSNSTSSFQSCVPRQGVPAVIGQTISHYRIIAKLGEGGMGVVYLGEDTHLARKVAIKFLSSSDPLYRARFLREARAVSALSHPNIAAVHDYGETDDGQPYIVMEFVKGLTLSKLLEEDTLTMARSIEIVMSIAEALGEAHHHGIVHRDVKPSNVVVNERGQVKVLDFGLVKQLAETGNGNIDPSAPTLFSVRTRSDVIVGTPLYLSPEQATGKPVDGRSDLFALGAVLYECITGRSAFAGQSVIEIGAQVIHVNPPAPSKITLGIPSELDRITMKALEKKVDSRYQTAEAFLKDLREVLPRLDASQIAKPISRSTLASVPLRTSALTTLTETLRRPRVSLGTLAIAVFAIVLVTAGLIWLTRPKPYTPTDAGRKWYNEGTAALRNGLFLQAKLAFDQAVSADPNFALAHARLAEALTELDYSDEAKTEMLRVSESMTNRAQLPRVDALYLEGIHKTVIRDFPAAINAFSEIARLSPNEAYVYFDLGRAYEKNDDTKKAIESYIETTNRDPQLAAAFLRIGILYGIQLDLASAAANFDRAETLYKALGSIEGQAEVFYERGFLFNKLRKVAEAREPLERALALAQTTNNQYQQIKILLKLGDVASDEGKVPQAREHMEKAIELARANSIDNLIKRGLVDLGNVFLVSGDYPLARNYFNQSLELAQKQKDNRNLARALLSLGSLAERESKPDETITYVEQALPFYRQSGYRKEMSQVFALLARAKVQKGEYDAALQAHDEQLKLAERLGDQSQAGIVHRDISYLFTTLARYPEALSHLDQSDSIAKSLGVQKDICLGLTMRGNVLWRLGRYDEASRSLADALSIAEQGNVGKNLTAWHHLANARMALSQHKFAEAKLNSQQADALAGTILKGTAVEANYTLGLAQALSGATREGQNKCDKAVKIATDYGDPVFLSEALLALAHTKLITGDVTGALTTALQSQEILARLGKQDSEWIAWLIAARASRNTGDETREREYATRASDLLSGLQQKWGKENYESYLNRPDIQDFRKQLSETLR